MEGAPGRQEGRVKTRRGYRGEISNSTARRDGPALPFQHALVTYIWDINQALLKVPVLIESLALWPKC